MIDLRILREHPERVKAAQGRRGESADLVDAMLAADVARRSSIADYERLRAEQKSLGRQIPAARGEEKQALLDKTRDLATQVKAAEARQQQEDERFDALALALPNLAEEAAPAGGEDDYAVLEHIGAPRDFTAEGFEPRDHVELGRLLGAIDIERGAKVSGARFYYLTGVGALLELALVQMAMAQAVESGFTPMIPPALVKPRAMEGSGFLGQAAADVYRLADDDFYLVGTSGAARCLPQRRDPRPRRAAAALRRVQPLLPARGGLIRQRHPRDHPRALVRQGRDVLAHGPGEAVAEHVRLLGWEKQFLDALELPYRVIDIAAGDLGLAAARKFDCEAWLPTQSRYLEVTSTSNCTDFQARRLDIRVRAAAGVEHVATLNGTLCAMTRTIVALLENHQQPDGSVRVPAALQPHLGGRTTLEPLA